MLELDAQFLGRFARRLHPLGRFLDRADALVGPSRRDDEDHGHLSLNFIYTTGISRMNAEFDANDSDFQRC
jgi:hypothetical protein